MAFAKFEENQFRIDGEIAENHAILVNLTASIIKLKPWLSYRDIRLNISEYNKISSWQMIGIRGGRPPFFFAETINSGKQTQFL